MALPEVDPQVHPVEALLAPDSRELDIPRSRRIFVNRNLRMKEIDLIGFDMDYTIALYNQAELEKLSIQLTLQKLVEKRGYPAAILGLDYSPSWAIRGLAVDRERGNICKMDRFGHVGRCFHGRQPLDREARAARYRTEKVRLSAPRYSWIDTLFALPEAVMYLNLVEYFEIHKNEGPVPDWTKLWQDVRESIDEAHRDDTLKSVIRADLGRYILADPDLPATLHTLRSSGKKLFLLTNSLWDYTDAVMKHLFAKMPGYQSWRSYFDIVIVGGAKPGFFTEKAPFLELDPVSGAALDGAPKAFHRGHVYQAGNLAAFESMAHAGGDRVLYIGDHIYGDILRAKKSSVWRTAMVIQELENELELQERFAARLRDLDELDRKRRNLDAELDYQQLLLKSLQRPADGLDGAAYEAAHRQARHALESHRAALRETTAAYDQLEGEVDLSFNPHWGPLFKEGNENSRFGEQVEDYACLYTSRVSNFLAYSPLRYFRAPRAKMPHER